MASDDYQIDGINISSIARATKQFYGECNLYKAQQQLDKYSITGYQVITQGIRFTIDGDKYTYWSKKNRVYKGTANTELTLLKFLKQIATGEFVAPKPIKQKKKKKAKKKVTCPHCFKSITTATMKLRHFDNCKLKIRRNQIREYKQQK